LQLVSHALLISIFWLSVSMTWAQSSSATSYSFLKIPQNARLAALGGVNVSLSDKDVNFFFSNPALAGDSLTGWASAGYMFYVADIGQASFAGSIKRGKKFVGSFGIQHFNYGALEGTDPTGMVTGTFRSGETALVFSLSHRVSNFRAGATSKFLFSNLAGFTAAAFAVDLGGLFIHPEHDFTVGLVIKNFGFHFSDYSESNQSSLPFDIQLGTTFKPEHMPLRFSFTAYNLVRPDYLYSNLDEEPSALNKIFSHVSIGAEILVHRNVNVLLGYNSLRQQELKVQQGGGGSGFSFGLAARIKSFDLVLSQSRYSVGQANYSITLAANLQDMIFKKRVL